MTRARRHAIALTAGLALAAGGSSLAAVRARAGPTSTTATAPQQLVNAYPLGPQRLCCQSRTASQKATPATTTAPHAAKTQSARHASGGQAGLSAAIWAVVALGAVLLAGVALVGTRTRHRLSGVTEPTGELGSGAPWPARLARAPDAVANGWSQRERVQQLVRSAGGGSGGAIFPGASADSGTGASSMSQAMPVGIDDAGPTNTAGEHAELAYRRADGAGDAGGAFNLGVLLHQRRDFAAAAAAYERAELRGDPDAAFNLGTLLYGQGDLDRAEAAWRRCMSRRHTQAAANLAFLLQRRGDLEGAAAARSAAAQWAVTDSLVTAAERRMSSVERAELAYRRADGAGDAGGAFNLGVLLHQRRDFAAAAAAYERAELRGDPDAAFNLGILLYGRGDLDRAEAAWRRCMSRRHTQAAANLAFLLQRRGDLRGAQEAHAAAETWASPGPSQSSSSPGAPGPSDEIKVQRL